MKLVFDAGECQLATGYVQAGALAATTALASNEGPHLVVACLKDDVGNVVFTTNTVTLGRAPPSGTVLIDGGAAFTGQRNVVASFLGVSLDVARVKAVLRQASAPTTSCDDSIGCVAFAANVALSIAPSEAAGSFVADVCFEDAAGNRSAVVASDDILFDTASPTVSLVLDGGASFTTSTQVRATVAATNGLGVVFSAMWFANDSPSFSGATESFAADRPGLALSSPTVEGTKTVCVEVTDTLGWTANDCDPITLDLSAPAGALTVPVFALLTSVGVTVRSDDLNIASVAVGEALDCGTATFTTLARGVNEQRRVTFADQTTEGSRTVVACFKDAAGQTARLERSRSTIPPRPA